MIDPHTIPPEWIAWETPNKNDDLVCGMVLTHGYSIYSVTTSDGTQYRPQSPFTIMRRAHADELYQHGKVVPYRKTGQ